MTRGCKWTLTGPNKPDTVWPDLQLANDMNDGMNYLLGNEYDKALVAFNRMKHEGPGDFPMPDNWLGVAYMRMGEPLKALAYMDSALAIDPYSVSSLTVKYDIYRRLGDSTKMDGMLDSIAQVCPWLAPMALGR